MIVRVDHSSVLPPFEQLRYQIAAAISAGEIHPGEALPSVRQLAADLQIAAGTVQRAYRELTNDGILIRRGRRGTFVADDLPPEPVKGDAALTTKARTFVHDARSLGADDHTIRTAVATALAAIPELQLRPQH